MAYIWRRYEVNLDCGRGMCVLAAPHCPSQEQTGKMLSCQFFDCVHIQEPLISLSDLCTCSATSDSILRSLSTSRSFRAPSCSNGATCWVLSASKQSVCARKCLNF